MAQAIFVNPKKRGSKGRKAKTTSRRRKSYRRNPLPKFGGVANQFKDGAIGAAGALGVDIAMAKLPIPANLKTGTFAPVVKGLVGVGLGMAVEKVMKNKRMGQQIALGAITVSLYNTGKTMLAPTLGLQGFEDQGMLGFEDNGLLGWDMDNELGYTSAAPSFADYDDLGYFETDFSE